MRENKNARQGIATEDPYAKFSEDFPRLRRENKNARQGIATCYPLSTRTAFHLGEKTKMPDRALRPSLRCAT